MLLLSVLLLEVVGVNKAHHDGGVTCDNIVRMISQFSSVSEMGAGRGGWGAL